MRSWQIVTTVTALAIAGIGLSYHAVRKTAGPDPRVELELEACRKIGIPTSGADTQPPIPPDSENAATVYAGWKASVQSNGIGKSPDYDLPKLLDFSQPDSAVETEFEIIKDNSEIIALIHRGAAMPKCVFKKDWSLGYKMPLPELADMRAMVRWLQGESGVLARHGKPIDAVRALSAGYQVENHVLQTHTAINYLTAFAMDQMVTKGMLSLAARYHDKPDVLEAIRSVISSEPPAMKAGDYMKTEVLSLIDTAGLMRAPEKEQREALGVGAGSPGTMSVIGVTQDLAGSGSTISQQDLASAQSEAVKAGADISKWKLKRIPILLPVIVAQPPRYNAAVYDRWVTDNEVLAIQTIRPVLAARGQSSDRMVDAAYDACGALAVELRKSVTAGQLQPSSTSLACLYVNLIFDQLRSQRVEYVVANRTIAKAATEVFLYRNKNGAYPASLDQMGDKSLVDPFRGSLLKYRRTTSGFMIFSVGRTSKYDGTATQPPTYEARYQYPPAERSG